MNRQSKQPQVGHLGLYYIHTEAVVNNVSDCDEVPPEGVKFSVSMGKILL